MAKRIARAPRQTRTSQPQDDGGGTRQHLLDVAGQVFAEKGFDRATGKEICQRAGANIAAVNYHFGGRDGLYAAVLAEAQSRLLTFSALSVAMSGEHSAEKKLKTLVELVAGILTGAGSTSWVFRVIGRELIAPSIVVTEFRQKEFLPRARLVKGIVSELLDVPANHPAVARVCINIMAPFAMLAIVDRSSLQGAFPQLRLVQDETDALAQHMLRYALAGIAAVRRELLKNG